MTLLTMDELDKRQREIVLTLVQGDAGITWSQQRTGWRLQASHPVCEWDGITCDQADNTITRINLAKTNLHGTIPTELGLLKSLIELELNNNDLVGSIPYQVANLPNLETFNVASNQLSHELPKFSSEFLLMFSVSRNQLKGTFDDDIGNRHSNLIRLDVGHNRMTGTIPGSIMSNLKNLKFLDISYNHFHGTIPPDVGYMTDLQGMFLNENVLTGTIPTTLGTGEDGVELKLVQVFLENNRLSGTIPATMADLPHLVDFYVDGNKLTGTVPNSICSLNLNANFFTEKDEGRDGCTSVSCPVHTVSREGVYPCRECQPSPDGIINPYLGQTGQCLDSMTEKKILDTLWEKTSGLEWTGGSGWGRSNVPVCAYQGVECDSFGHVVGIYLSGMGLKGEIPDQIGLLPHLQRLDLSDNKLSGYLPSDLRFPPLTDLDISGNKIKGIVPPMLCFKNDVNGNGKYGDYHCDAIACPAGTWSPIGRAGESDNDRRYLKSGDTVRYECEPCGMTGAVASYIGRKSCFGSSYSIAQGLSRKRGNLFKGFILVTLLAGVLFFLFKYQRSQQKKKQGNDEDISSDIKHSALPSDDVDDDKVPDKSYTDNYSDEEVEMMAASGDGSTLAAGKRNLGALDRDDYEKAKQTDDDDDSSKEGNLLQLDGTVPSANTTTDAEEDRDWDAKSDKNDEELWLDVPKIS